MTSTHAACNLKGLEVCVCVCVCVQHGPITCSISCPDKFTWSYDGSVWIDKTNDTDVDHDIVSPGHTHTHMHSRTHAHGHTHTNTNTHTHSTFSAKTQRSRHCSRHRALLVLATKQCNAAEIWDGSTHRNDCEHSDTQLKRVSPSPLP